MTRWPELPRTVFVRHATPRRPPPHNQRAASQSRSFLIEASGCDSLAVPPLPLLALPWQERQARAAAELKRSPRQQPQTARAAAAGSAAAVRSEPLLSARSAPRRRPRRDVRQLWPAVAGASEGALASVPSQVSAATSFRGRRRRWAAAAAAASQSTGVTAAAAVASSVSVAFSLPAGTGAPRPPPQRPSAPRVGGGAGGISVAALSSEPAASRSVLLRPLRERRRGAAALARQSSRLEELDPDAAEALRDDRFAGDEDALDVRHPAAAVAAVQGHLSTEELRRTMKRTGLLRGEVVNCFRLFSALCSCSRRPDGIDTHALARGLPILTMEDGMFVRSLFTRVDSDMEGSLSWDEFVDLVKTLQGSSKLELARFLFRVYDNDGSGVWLAAAAAGGAVWARRALAPRDRRACGVPRRRDHGGRIDEVRGVGLRAGLRVGLVYLAGTERHARGA